MRAFCWFIFVSVCTCCSPENHSPEEHFYVEVNGALLPVKIRGNLKSNEFILFVNGGPGVAGIDLSVLDPGNWEMLLEKDYALVYYDQRGLGNTQGKLTEESITLDQYVKDISSIAAVLKSKYPNSRLTLMGHSFGALLTYRHASRVSNSLFDKYIALAGAAFHISDSKYWEFRRGYVNDLAEKQLAANSNDVFWKEALDFSDNSPLGTMEERAKLFEFMTQNGIVEEVSITAKDALKILLNSEVNFWPYYLYTQKTESLTNSLIDQERSWKIEADIKQIKRPILLVGGEFDYNVPPQELSWIFEHIPGNEKQLKIIPNAGHDMYISESEAFCNTIKAYIND